MNFNNIVYSTQLYWFSNSFQVLLSLVPKQLLVVKSKSNTCTLFVTGSQDLHIKIVKCSRLEKFLETWYLSQDHLKAGDLRKKGSTEVILWKRESLTENWRVGTYVGVSFAYTHFSILFGFLFFCSVFFILRCDWVLFFCWCLFLYMSF